MKWILASHNQILLSAVCINCCCRLMVSAARLSWPRPRQTRRRGLHAHWRWSAWGRGAQRAAARAAGQPAPSSRLQRPGALALVGHTLWQSLPGHLESLGWSFVRGAAPSCQPGAAGAACRLLRQRAALLASAVKGVMWAAKCQPDCVEWSVLCLGQGGGAVRKYASKWWWSAGGLRLPGG